MLPLREGHISNLFQHSPKHCSLISLVHLLQLRSDQHPAEINELLTGCVTLMSNAADRDSDQFGMNMSAGRDLSLAGPIPQPFSIRG